jgi:(S)-2-hydroxy-acid oxidase
MSTLSTTSIEEVSEITPGTIKWFQLYIYKDRNETKALVERAEKAGFKTLVLTVDAPIFGLRRANLREEFKLSPEFELSNIKKGSNVEKSSIKSYVHEMLDDSLTWKDVEWLMR